ncbi:MAG: hypothetical protein IPK85_11785 [Gemmatimonadetes bacterium]|nr:hypothetical protein [Gemmatimonadota bacterium]
MSVSTLLHRAGTLALAAALAACADAPTTVLVLDMDANFGRVPVNPSPSLGLADIEFFEVCKQYVGAVGPAVTVDVQVDRPSLPTDTTFQVTLADGQCRDIWLHGGAAEVVTVTEQPVAGYTTSFVKEVKTRTTYTVDPAASGNTSSGNVSGNPGEGTLVRFINTELPPPPSGCTYTQGYWKTHSLAGPAPYDAGWQNIGPLEHNTPFYGSGKTWLALWNTPPKKGNVYIQLAHQYMAAKLNVLNGAGVPANVSAALTAAEAYFSTGAGDITGLASLLDDYNNGLIGPGHCS